MANTTTLHNPRNSPPSLLASMAARFGVEPEKMLSTLKATAFKGRKDPSTGRYAEVSNEQLIMLLIVANQYNLNPFTKEIYAFPDKSGGIVPIVGVDGWIRIMQEHSQFRGIEFSYSPDGSEDAWVEAIIHRADRPHPFTAREFLSECYRKTEPWDTCPRRMLRHKALIQAARLAFGFAGIYDPDEADRIIDSTVDLLPSSKAAATAPEASNPAALSFAQPDQCEVLYKSLEHAGIPVNEALEQFGVKSFEELPFNRVTEVVEWIRKQ